MSDEARKGHYERGDTWTPDRLILRGKAANEDIQFEAAWRRGIVSDRFHVTVTPDDQLGAGFYEALAVLDRQSLGRLLHWLRTGEALPRDDERIPEPFTEAAR